MRFLKWLPEAAFSLGSSSTCRKADQVIRRWAAAEERQRRSGRPPSMVLHFHQPLQPPGPDNRRSGVDVGAIIDLKDAHGTVLKREKNAVLASPQPKCPGQIAVQRGYVA